jgi:nucleotide-binding universal stress UspA family protein
MNVVEKPVKANKRASDRPFNIEKIIVAVDLSPHSAKTAAYGAEFAKSVGATVTLLHVFPPEPSIEFGTEALYKTFEAGRRLDAQKLIELVEQVRQTGVKCDHDFRVGDPAEQITQAAQTKDADLIITAAHHPGFLGRLFNMDQAPRILHRASCPVLVYHEGSQ